MSTRPRLVLVHGSVTGATTWTAQTRDLADRFELVVVARPGFPPGPPIDRVDFELEAPWLAAMFEPGDHLVGHSYGGVVCLYAAAERPDALASLTVIEPPCTQAARGNPAADAFGAGARELWATGPTDDREAFLRLFLRAVVSNLEPPSPLPPELAQGAAALVRERGPWEAVIPVEELRAGGVPTLVVSGAHHEAFDAICETLAADLRAEHLVLPGFGHTPQRHPEFNGLLEAFVRRSA